MNAFNVWSLTDLADPQRLSVVVARTPACVNVSGWSYHGGKRRGLIIRRKGEASGGGASSSTSPEIVSVEIGSGADAIPAPILHYAAVRGSVACINVALDFGADATLRVGGLTADEIAQAVGSAPAAETIRAAARLQRNPELACEEGEAAARQILLLSEGEAWDALVAHYVDGVATVEIEFREGFGQPNSTHTVRVPRFSSCKLFLSKLERLFDQRLTVAFPIAKEEIRRIHRLPVLATAAPLPAPAAGGGSGDDSDEDYEAPGALGRSSGATRRSGGAPVTRMLTLSSRTMPYLLHMNQPRCIARPFLPGTRAPPPLSDSAAETLKSISPSPRSPNTSSKAGQPRNDSRLSTAETSSLHRRGSLSKKLSSLTKEIEKFRREESLRPESRGPLLDQESDRRAKSAKSSHTGRAQSPVEDRIAAMKQLVEQAERELRPPASATIKKLPREAIEELTQRLSTFAAKQLREKREAHEAYIADRYAQLVRTGIKPSEGGSDGDE